MDRHDALAGASDLLSVEELRIALHAEGLVLAEFIELGLATPCAGPGGALLVTPAEAERLARALRLARELELHAAGAALLVELLEERERLRRRLEAMDCLAGPLA
jgi:chaperone modulatory protein CbpM